MEGLKLVYSGWLGLISVLLTVRICWESMQWTYGVATIT